MLETQIVRIRRVGRTVDREPHGVMPRPAGDVRRAPAHNHQAVEPRRPSARLGERGVKVFAEQPGELVWLVLLNEVASCGQQR
jgi:hypothetical protein